MEVLGKGLLLFCFLYIKFPLAFCEIFSTVWNYCLLLWSYNLLRIVGSLALRLLLFIKDRQFGLRLAYSIFMNFSLIHQVWLIIGLFAISFVSSSHMEVIMELSGTFLGNLLIRVIASFLGKLLIRLVWLLLRRALFRIALSIHLLLVNLRRRLAKSLLFIWFASSSFAAITLDRDLHSCYRGCSHRSGRTTRA